MIFPETVRTTRLLLRRPQPEDAKAIFDEYAQDAAVTRYLVWSPHSTVETTKAFIASSIARWDQAAAYPYVIANATSADLLGMIEIRPHGHRADFGFVLARRYWRRGFGSEAITAIVRIAISRAEIFRVEATCDVENIASARALEKAGLTREGLLRRYIIHPTISSEPRDTYIYAIVR